MITQEDLEKAVQSAYRLGFSAGINTKEDDYKLLYGDDFEEVLKNSDTGFKGVFDEDGSFR